MVIVSHVEMDVRHNPYVVVDGYAETEDIAKEWCRLHYYRPISYSNVIKNEYTISKEIKELKLSNM